MGSQSDIARWGTIAFAGSALIAAIAIGYGSIAKTGRPPTTTASATASQSTDELEAAAKADPSNPAGWLALGSRHVDAGNFTEAAVAYRHATGAAPGNALAWSALGEAVVMASKHDPMPAEARAAFRQAVTLDPRDPRARYFLAVDRDLTGDHRGAIDDWFALLKDTPPGAPWGPDLRRTIEQVAKINKIDIADRLAAAPSPAALAGAPVAGPNADDLRAAATMTPSQQAAMATEMVARLEAKLKANPANPPGWLMLMRSRMTLGEPAKATQALKDAVAANPGAAAQLRAEAAALAIP